MMNGVRQEHARELQHDLTRDVHGLTQQLTLPIVSASPLPLPPPLQPHQHQEMVKTEPTDAGGAAAVGQASNHSSGDQGDEYSDEGTPQEAAMQVGSAGPGLYGPPHPMAMAMLQVGFNAAVRRIMEQASAAGALSKKRKRNTKKREPQDPRSSLTISSNAPRRPRTAFHIFFHGNLRKWKEQHPEMDLVKLSQEASRQWRDMTDEQKRPYHEAKKEEEATYQKELAVFEEAQRLHAQQMGFIYPPGLHLGGGGRGGGGYLDMPNTLWKCDMGPPPAWTPEPYVQRWGQMERILQAKDVETVDKGRNTVQLHEQMRVYQVQLTDRKTKMLERLRDCEAALDKYYYPIFHRILTATDEKELLAWAAVFNPPDPEHKKMAIEMQFVPCNEEEVARRLLQRLLSVAGNQQTFA
ncbi:unnamed protein product [Vitrella brassicaformis CCMP3155]|uniref:HMG box domain-containing protein n=4 Tax=Vitrella brassicaformis TaxID=1169539 RepID=A0A0G4EWV7_VITBC|nr:unnamed protein product [Vitrella brassicaformis CCMP3155]|mmetsp:Transcript_28240/g.81363  ORF Transcript_28240/g.81363 Transcript_28240/m.81363 type:complete len:410 (+) Transcript_28240:62-1291(+)|eukprot:CEM03472.1 unnamed protein product [Vitrella brassicaformis CCMP3155]